MRGPGLENEFAKRAKKMKYPLQMSKKNYGASTKIGARKVQVCAQTTRGPGKCYGARTIMTKVEGVEPITFKQMLIMEQKNDITMLPDLVISEIQGNIRKGAKDLAQKWKNALELTQKAYEVTNVRQPTPEQKGAWKNYEDLIKYSVQQLAKTRGLGGDWRLSAVMPVHEAVSTKRFFVEMPNAGTTEVDAKKVEEVIDSITNKLRRHGLKTRIEEKSKFHTILSVWQKKDEKEEQVETITIKQVS